MDTQNTEQLNLEVVREKLARRRGKEFWRSLEQVAETPEFQAWVEDEFPNRRSIAELDRRSFLKFMGASMLLAGVGGCRSLRLPSEHALPYTKMPEDLVPGMPMQFTTAFEHNGTVMGLVVESHEGRPTKIDGLEAHPNSLGSSNHFAQAELLGLYDPDRFEGVLHKGQASQWELFTKNIRASIDELKPLGGAGLYVVLESNSSPTIQRLAKKIANNLPNARIATYDAVGHESEREGLNTAFGQPARAHYDLTKASVVLSLDADFLYSMGDSVRLSREFMDGRRVQGTDVANMNRLYAAEATPTTTGAMADHRISLKPHTIEALARQVAAELGVSVADVPNDTAIPTAWVKEVAKDLLSKGSRAVVMAGQFTSPAVHALAAAMNSKLGSQCVHYLAAPAQGIDLKTLHADLYAEKAKVLIMLGGDPAYTGPADLILENLIKRVPVSVHHTQYFNQTSKVSTWVTGDSHFLEAWGDLRAMDGTTSVVQPLIAPLHDTKSRIEFLGLLLSDARGGYDIVRETHGVTPANESAWTELLNTGVQAGAALPASLIPAGQMNLGPSPKPKGTTIVFRPDPTIWDGRYANNGWLQELPKVMTTLTWENAALISPSMAQTLDVRDGDHVSVEVSGGRVVIPAMISVGHPDDSVTLHLGYGRTEIGSIGEGAGANAYFVRSSTTLWHADDATIKRASGRSELALTQTHHSMEGRDILKAATVAEFLQNPTLHTEGDELGKKAEEGIEMFPSYKTEFPFEGPQWGMSIDLNVCTGCHACVTACQAENNIPVVGKDQVRKGREMHWIRIDRYYRVRGHSAEEAAAGVMTKNVEITNSRDITDYGDSLKDVLDSKNLETVFAPVACMHCEKAPCEPVCPVAATVHSHEGLNQMVYNRCVGTRYCSNNCPYKVRRFNFLNYTDNQAQFMDRHEVANGLISSEKPHGREYLKLMSNPDVTVRGRGVMEKCTYCVQKINKSRIAAKKQKRDIRDGEIVTACEAACPTQAITFGNIADPTSRVSKLKADVRTYAMLPELNTRNRTTYMARLRNPNPALENA
ncbi:MAG: TAT-variant-translocated molybdopterin oxidoreductase [Chthonomonas sp.]|nr:TAT-variant-translocated molybdopterin oxidoreductase [Chthonomonas sp.]